MKILITGCTGLLGPALVRRLAPEVDVTGVSRHPATLPGARHAVCDLTDAAAVEALIRTAAPDVVIHAQAQSDVDVCERDPVEAFRQNVQTTEHLCRAMAGRDALLIGISTDYVFSGDRREPYDEAQPVAPVNVYGRTKVALEALVRAVPRGIVARVSTLFGPDRRNFCATAAAALASGQPVEAFVDQTTSPSSTLDVADGLAAMIAAVRGRGWDSVPRTVHVANAGAGSRLEVAREVAAAVGASAELIRPIRMTDQRRAGPRPPYSALVGTHYHALIGRSLRGWQEALHAYLQADRRWLSSGSGSPTKPRASASSG